VTHFVTIKRFGWLRIPSEISALSEPKVEVRVRLTSVRQCRGFKHKLIVKCTGGALQPRGCFFPLLLPIVLLGLTGCNDLGLRKGPAPVLDVISVQTAASHQIAIINALAQDAGYDHPGEVSYYEVAQAGFNYVDDQCNAYFDEMFFLDRRRSEIKSGLLAASATTATILGLTNASTMSLAIVASAFGFASNATDIVVGTYVYAHPAETKVLVNKFQTAFRDGAAANPTLINSRTSAYYAIQRYLSLCLPPTIEAEIAKQIDATIAVGAPAGPGSLVSVRTGSSLTLQRAPLVGPAPLNRQEARAARVTNLKNTVISIKPTSSTVNRARESFIRQVKAALCVPETDASLSPATELAIKDYLRAMGVPIPGQIEPFSDPSLQPVLMKAINAVQNCKAERFESSYEVGAFGVPADGRADSIKQVQSTLNDKLKLNGSSTVVKETGSFDTQTRDAIEELRVLRKLSPGRQIDLTLDKYLSSPNR
jgi:hypothetical protein